jgi:hypothetical protein
MPTVLLLALVLAQSPGTLNKPDFSGRWTLLSADRMTIPADHHCTRKLPPS